MNNPFAQPPRSQLQDTAQRFPDILAEDPDLRQPQQQGFYPQQQQQQPQYQQQQYTGFQQPQQTGYGQQGGGAYLQPQGTGFGGGGGYGGGGLSPGGYQQQQQQPQQQFYQPQPSPSSYADLDPYSSLSAFASQPSPSPSGQQSQQQGGGTLLAVQQTQSHPRQFVQENKAALTAWDDYAWKQLLGRVDVRYLPFLPCFDELLRPPSSRHCEKHGSSVKPGSRRRRTRVRIRRSSISCNGKREITSVRPLLLLRWRIH